MTNLFVFGYLSSEEGIFEIKKWFLLNSMVLSYFKMIQLSGFLFLTKTIVQKMIPIVAYKTEIDYKGLSMQHV